MNWALAFALVLAFAQVFLHTHMEYVVLHFAYVVLWVMAFNIAGGFTRASGSFIFWFGAMTVLSGSIVKLCIGEAPDTNSAMPILSMAVYTACMAIMLLAAIATTKIVGNTESIAERIMLRRRFSYHEAASGALIVCLLMFVLGFILPGGEGTIFGAISRLNLLQYMAIILGTIDAVQSSNGKRCVNWIVLVSGGLLFLNSVQGFSKQDMFSPFVCWVVGIAFARFRLRLVHFAVCTAFLSFVLLVMVPIAQIGRSAGRELPTAGARFALVGNMIENIGYYRQVQEIDEESRLAATSDYFGKNVGGMAERLTTWPLDDQLIAYSTRGHFIGYNYLWYLFCNWLPHLVLPNKESLMPADAGGNYYARQLGAIGPEDETTGVSFGLPAEVYHLAGWQAITLVVLPLLLLHFLVIEIIAGDIRSTPWGLFYAMFFSHMAPESGLNGLIYFIWYSNLAMILCILATTYLAPLAGQLIAGRQQVAEPTTQPA